MPKFIPIMPDSFNGSSGEEKAFDALRLLDNSYTVFHSLNWVGISNRTQGEADFVIVHPAKGILVVEVKSGGIEYNNGDWIQTNTITGFSKKIAPFYQARRSQYEILERLQLSPSLSRPPLVCHAVWFTSIEIMPTDKLPPDAPKEIVFDKVTLDEAQKAIDDAFEYWANKKRIKTLMDSRQLNEVIDNLAPYFHAVPGMNSVIKEAEQYYIKLTEQQAILLDYLKEQKIAVIHGLAGTGKTVLAKEKAKRLADEGGSVLFLCYNSFLKEYLRQNFSQPGIAFHNVHSLAAEILNDPNIELNELLNALEEYLDLMEPIDWPYDHVVIDEGQDLDEGLVNRLNELVKAKGGNFYVFYDRNQYVMKNQVPDWIEKAECKLVLHRNCRNTVEIHKTACSLIAVDANISDMSIHGEQPVATFITNRSELLVAANKFVKKAIEAGIEPENIVFLTIETEDKSLLGGVTTIEGINISSDRVTDHILFTSVRKFKGLEAKAVMLIDISINSLTIHEKQRLIYVGCSRAKHLLEITIVDDTDQKNIGECLRKINPSRNVPKNKKGLGRLLNIGINK